MYVIVEIYLATFYIYLSYFFQRKILLGKLKYLYKIKSFMVHLRLDSSFHTLLKFYFWNSGVLQKQSQLRDLWLRWILSIYFLKERYILSVQKCKASDFCGVGTAFYNSHGYRYRSWNCFQENSSQNMLLETPYPSFFLQTTHLHISGMTEAEFLQRAASFTQNPIVIHFLSFKGGRSPVEKIIIGNNCKEINDYPNLST